MTTVAKLSADLTANTSRFEIGMKRANSVMNNSRNVWSAALTQGGRSFEAFGSKAQQTSGIIGNLKGEIGGLAAVAAASLSVDKIIRYSDTWKGLEGRLKIISENMGEVRAKQEALFQVAQRSGAPLESVTNLYTKLNQALTASQRAQFNTLGITETFGKALAVTGEGAAQAQAAILQFTQAVQSDFKGVAQEINSLQDSAPRIAAVLKDMAAQSGKSLKQFAADGQLSTATVLRALENAGVKIDEEFGGIQKTVSRSLTEIDNAFLRYIGRSDVVASGTSSLAEGLSSLAENFEMLANVVGVIAAVQLAKVVSGFVLARAAIIQETVALTANAIAMNAATAAAAGNARMSLALAKAQQAAAGSFAASTIAVGSTGVAVVATTTAMTRAAAAATMLGRGLLAAFGGPIGLAVTALAGGIYYLATRTSEAEKIQQKYNETSSKISEINLQLMTASGEREKSLKAERLELIKTTEAQLADAKARIINLKSYNIGNANLANYGVTPEQMNAGEIGKEQQNIKTIEAQLASLKQEIIDFDKQTANLKNTPATVLGAGSGKDSKQAEKTLESVINGLQQESKELEIQNQMYGQQESAISRARKELQIYNQLQQAGVVLTAAQKKEIDGYLDSIERQTELQDEQVKQQKMLEEQEKNRKEALDQLGATFESAFEDAIVSGSKLSDVLQGLLDDVLRLLVRTQITAPLADAFTGSGGILSSIGSAIFGGGGSSSAAASWYPTSFALPSFAVGSDYIPRDMTANIHKGEMIIPAGEAAAMRRGGGGGGDVNVIIQNNNGSQVSQSSRKNSSGGTDVLMQLDNAVGDRLSKKGTKSNQALQAQANRSLIRRG